MQILHIECLNDVFVGNIVYMSRRRWYKIINKPIHKYKNYQNMQPFGFAYNNYTRPDEYK